MWFDSHCHLHLCEDVDAVVGRARSAGIVGILTLGTDIATSERSVEIARSHDVVAAVGVHPTSATEWDEAGANRIEELLREDAVVAVGESGLDFYWDSAPPAKQEEAFTAHIALAKTHDKTLVIHTRESVDRTIEVLEAESPPERLIFHCWSGDTSQLDRALALGAYISFAGNVSFKSAGDLRVAAAKVPDDRLLIETDSPYLAPVPHRGRPNEPAYVADVGAAVAAARSQPPEVLGELTSQNARAVFSL